MNKSCPPIAPSADPDLLEDRALAFSHSRGTPSDLSGIDQVIAPLFGRGLDGYELIVHLAAARFQGRLSLTSGALPDRGMVLRELRDLARPLGISVEMTAGRA